MPDWVRPNLRRETLRDYTLGFALFAAAFGVRYFGETLLDGLPFITFILAVLFTAYFGGWRAACPVAVASLLSAWYFFLEPRGSFALVWPQKPLALLFFATVCVSQIGLVAMLVESLRRRDVKGQELERQRQLQQILFQELQHRVANGMQMISSILSLQGRLLAPQSEGKAAIDAASMRLSTLARVHRRLHDPALGGEGIGTALKEITGDVLAAAGRQDVKLTVEAPVVDIGPAAGTSLAMVVAEVTTNALKHAFEGRTDGTLEVKLRQIGAEWLLTVTDNGPGFPVDRTPDRSSLGLMIVRSMASRLHGEVEFTHAEGGGACVRLRFPDPSTLRETPASNQAQHPARRSTDRERANEAQASPEQA
ncbi:MAG: ATP-binding protein [Pseudomonadota bacterium]